MGVLPVRQAGSRRTEASRETHSQRKPRGVAPFRVVTGQQAGGVQRHRRRRRSGRHRRQRRMQRMTEPGAVQRVADPISIPAHGREQERQSVLEPITRAIQPSLSSQGCLYSESGIADPISILM